MRTTPIEINMEETYPACNVSRNVVQEKVAAFNRLSMGTKMILDIGTSGMNSTTAVHQWNPLDILDVEHSSFRYGLLILNQPINVPRDLMLSLWNKATMRVTVDGGTNRWFHFLQNGDYIPPDLITGDMDSIKQNVLAYFKSKGTRIILTPNQNETDFTKALRHFQCHVASEKLQLDGVIAVCETSGRLDQILTNLNTLYKTKEIIGDLPMYQLASDSLTWLLTPGQHRIFVGETIAHKGGWCSLIPVGARVENVTTTGLKWNLNNRSMEFGGLISSSNTYSGEPEITVKTSGPLVWSMGLRDDNT
ncbi:thiamine pyrophosphokinase 1 isoform X1 [Periplaneta americana]|uniref:thiamine pyrophosphokinase 1 isoform X1 n=1 Tax=Periplaneta americana TaxID=6978 RepID=UPI0037E8CB19